MSWITNMIEEKILIDTLLDCSCFVLLPREIFLKIMNKVIKSVWVTILNVSPYTALYKHSSNQRHFSIIPADGLCVRRRRSDDIFESAGAKRVLKSCQTTIVLAYGTKLPKWLFLLKDKRKCLVL